MKSDINQTFNLKMLELPVGNTGICFRIRGKPVEMLELPVGMGGISFGMHGKPLENPDIPVGKMVYVLELMKSLRKNWNYQLEMLK